MLGTRTWGDRMEGTDESTELWWNPYFLDCFFAERNRLRLRHVMIKNFRFPKEGHDDDGTSQN